MRHIKESLKKQDNCKENNKMVKKIIFIAIVFWLVLLQYSCENSLEPSSHDSYIPELILINKDLTFTMGCVDSLGFIGVHRDVYPYFTAMLSPYYIGKYEVRNDEYNHFVADSGYFDSSLWSEDGWKYIQSENRIRPVDWIESDEPWSNRELSNTPDRPINNITWYEAEAYCNWLSRETGENYALPTEGQWERAARGPDPGRIFAYGNEHDASKYNNIMYSRKLYPVGYYKKDRSYDGGYDMAGNLLEFCFDLYDVEIYQKYKESEPVYNPAGPDSNITGYRSLRGSFNFFHQDPVIEYQIQTITRMNCNPRNYYQIFGFRIVKNIE
jgi:formylglycine-generating enzyme required for sulfatase activity